MNALSRKLMSAVSVLLPSRSASPREKKKMNSPLVRESDQRIRDDEYIPWICHTTGGWLHESSGNLRAFDYAIKNMPIKGSVVEAFSDDFFDRWESGLAIEDLFDRPVKLGGEISFAYIDGAHSYEASKKDFENIDRYLVPGGFVFFDDSKGKGPFESSRTAQEVLNNPRYELVFTTPNYLFRRTESS